MEKLSKNDPAWNLLDAFDAVTNGMENPEAMKKASLLKGEELEPWKHLVNAIACLYSGDTEGCKKSAEKIGKDSPPASLKPIFKAWSHLHEIRMEALDTGGLQNAACEELSGSSPAVLELFQRLIIEPHPLSLIAEQAEEALRQGLEEQFSSLASKVLNSLHERGSALLALRYVIYCFSLLNEAGAEGSEFFSMVVKTLGKADGFCASGFALIGRDNRTAASVLKQAIENSGEEKTQGFLSAKTAGMVEEIIKFLESGNPRRAHLARFPSGNHRRARSAKFRSQLELFGEDNLLIERALRVPASFEELEGELPPAARYLGPGIWMKAIKESGE
jgi:hypothetical protein